MAKVPSMHQVGDHCKVFMMRHMITWKPYYQCLLALEQLQDKGLEGLSSAQVPGYYRAVLDSGMPSSVALAKTDKFYAAIEDGTAAAEASGSSGESHDSYKPRAVPPPVFQCQKIQVGKRAHVSARPQGAAAASLVQDLLGLQDDIQAKASSSSSSSRSSSCQSHRSGRNTAPRQEGSPSRRSNASADTRADRVSRERPCTLEGVPVVVDEHGTLGERDYYRRFCVKCTVASHGPKCSKRRNTGDRQTRKFGPNEPLGFLGAWLQHGEMFSSHEDHVKFVPSFEDIAVYMQKNQLM